jgi:hypothetical protein
MCVCVCVCRVPDDGPTVVPKRVVVNIMSVQYLNVVLFGPHAW